MTYRLLARWTHRPGGVVILSSHSRNLPWQYFCAWGIWNTSSYHVSVTVTCRYIGDLPGRVQGPVLLPDTARGWSQNEVDKRTKRKGEGCPLGICFEARGREAQWGRRLILFALVEWASRQWVAHTSLRIPSWQVFTKAVDRVAQKKLSRSQTPHDLEVRKFKRVKSTNLDKEKKKLYNEWQYWFEIDVRRLNRV